jgi:hypothetical protein
LLNTSLQFTNLAFLALFYGDIEQALRPGLLEFFRILRISPTNAAALPKIISGARKCQTSINNRFMTRKML